jgi:hypothetical protein
MPQAARFNPLSREREAAPLANIRPPANRRVGRATASRRAHRRTKASKEAHRAPPHPRCRCRDATRRAATATAKNPCTKNRRRNTSSRTTSNSRLPGRPPARHRPRGRHPSRSPRRPPQRLRRRLPWRRPWWRPASSANRSPPRAGPWHTARPGHPGGEANAHVGRPGRLCRWPRPPPRLLHQLRGSRPPDTYGSPRGGRRSTASRSLSRR